MMTSEAICLLSVSEVVYGVENGLASKIVNNVYYGRLLKCNVKWSSDN